MSFISKEEFLERLSRAGKFILVNSPSFDVLYLKVQFLRDFSDLLSFGKLPIYFFNFDPFSIYLGLDFSKESLKDEFSGEIYDFLYNLRDLKDFVVIWIERRRLFDIVSTSQYFLELRLRMREDEKNIKKLARLKTFIEELSKLSPEEAKTSFSQDGLSVSACFSSSSSFAVFKEIFTLVCKEL